MSPGFRSTWSRREKCVSKRPSTQVYLQHTLLCTQFRVGFHFQPHQHRAHAVQQRIAVYLAVSFGVFQAAGLSGRTKVTNFLPSWYMIYHGRFSL